MQVLATLASRAPLLEEVSHHARARLVYGLRYTTVLVELANQHGQSSKVAIAHRIDQFVTFVGAAVL